MKKQVSHQSHQNTQVNWQQLTDEKQTQTPPITLLLVCKHKNIKQDNCAARGKTSEALTSSNANTVADAETKNGYYRNTITSEIYESNRVFVTYKEQQQQQQLKIIKQHNIKTLKTRFM